MTIEERLRKVRLLLLDVDGVLTDGRIMLDDNNVQSKSFDVTDGHGLKMIQRIGIEVGIITGRSSRVVEHRANELGIGIVHQGAKNKLIVARQILAERGIAPEEVAYIGDDIIDLPVMLQVGLAVTVTDAQQVVKSRAHWVLDLPGGYGAVRQFCDALLKARGAWEDATRRYFEPEPL